MCRHCALDLQNFAYLSIAKWSHVCLYIRQQHLRAIHCQLLRTFHWNDERIPVTSINRRLTRRKYVHVITQLQEKISIQYKPSRSSGKINQHVVKSAPQNYTCGHWSTVSNRPFVHCCNQCIHCKQGHWDIYFRTARTVQTMEQALVEKWVCLFMIKIRPYGLRHSCFLIVQKVWHFLFQTTSHNQQMNWFILKVSSGGLESDKLQQVKEIMILIVYTYSLAKGEINGIQVHLQNPLNMTCVSPPPNQYNNLPPKSIK